MRAPNSTAFIYAALALAISAPAQQPRAYHMSGDVAGTPFLTANARWLGPGGESILMHGRTTLGRKNDDLIVFHAYDATSGKPFMQISTIAWTGDWPHATLATE